MSRSLISEDYNPVTGLTTRYWSVDGGRKVTVQVLQDVEPNLSQNMRELNSYSSKSRVPVREGLGTKVASIPMGIVAQLRKEKGIDVLKCPASDLKKLLNDPDFAKLRTAPGRI